MTTTITATELSRSELEELGVDVPSDEDFYTAYRNDETTITVVVHDPDGGSWLDPPNEDHSGEDAWEWIAFGSGRERDRWVEDNFCCQECGNEGGYPDEACSSGYEESDKHIYPDAFRPGLDFWIERYEHGAVIYAPIGESSQVDRQWDVAQGVALMRFTKPDTIGPDDDPDKLLNFARGVCTEYTSWCNGEVYGLIEHKLRRPEVKPVPFMVPEDFAMHWEQGESCWGYIGFSNAESAAKWGL